MLESITGITFPKQLNESPSQEYMETTLKNMEKAIVALKEDIKCGKLRTIEKNDRKYLLAEIVAEEGSSIKFPLNLTQYHEYLKKLGIEKPKAHDIFPLIHVVIEKTPEKYFVDIDTLIEVGANVEEEDNQRETPLAKAITCGKAPMVTHLLEKHQANINATDLHGNTLLEMAISYGRTEIAKILFTKDAMMSEGRTPLHYASYCNNLEFLKFLLSEEVDAKAKDKDGKTPLHHMACYPRNFHYNDNLYNKEKEKKIISLLVEHGAEINTQDNNGMTPLDHAIRMGLERGIEMSLVEQLVQHGAKITANTASYLLTRDNWEYPIDWEHGVYMRNILAALGVTGNVLMSFCVEVETGNITNPSMSNAEEDNKPYRQPEKQTADKDNVIDFLKSSPERRKKLLADLGYQGNMSISFCMNAKTGKIAQANIKRRESQLKLVLRSKSSPDSSRTADIPTDEIQDNKIAFMNTAILSMLILMASRVDISGKCFSHTADTQNTKGATAPTTAFSPSAQGDMRETITTTAEQQTSPAK
jgi:ankyrin repeat protein